MDRHKSAIEGVLDDGTLDRYRRIRAGYETTLLSTAHAAELQEVEYHLWKLHYHLIDEFRRGVKSSRGFELFLSEANEFYKKLIVDLRESRGAEVSVERTCHRLLICLGDLARYTEIVKRSDAREWSVAASYYFEASRTWAHSGNPHNQLALLATYVGDEFLALYHCVRSLAVEEPFPDAWRNIVLLFEENRSAELRSFSRMMQLDFSNPSEKAKPKAVCSGKSDLWPLLVRTISFFLIIGSRLEEFPCSLASALRCLEAELAMDDASVTLLLECYESLDSSRRGPYRAIQLVSIFIFILDTLTEKGERNEESKPFALAAVFICVGRLTERCFKGQRNVDPTCPILPAVLVFAEWLVGAVDAVESNGDERVKNALSYFYSTLSDLLDRVERNGDEVDPNDRSALWEDRELKGFSPLKRVHETLDFEDHAGGNGSRLRRVIRAGMRISDLSKNFRVLSSTKAPIEEDEEVILFKPMITRRNSAPPAYVPEPPEKGEKTETPPADEWRLRHATSFSFPSLSAWNIETKQPKLSPIEESLIDLSIDDDITNESSIRRATSVVPSAPPYPDEEKNEAEGILGIAPIIGFADGYHRAPFVGMSSSEWLYRYRNGQNMAAAAAGNGSSFMNFRPNEVMSGFDHFVSSCPVVYLGESQQNREVKYYVGYQRTFPNNYYHVMEQEPTLVQYLKEKERQLQCVARLDLG